MKTPITSVPSISNTLVASGISRPDKTQILIQLLDQLSTDSFLTSNIEFQNGESVQSYKWIKLQNPSFKPISSKKRRNSTSDEPVNSNVNTIQFMDCLVILLSTGEVLIYSTLTKEFINKISTDSPFSAIEVINDLKDSDYDIVTFDNETSSLKFFSSTSPQLVNSIQFKTDDLISYILSKNGDLLLASNDKLYLLSSEYKIAETFDITLQSPSSPLKNNKSTTQQSQQSILKILEEGSRVYVTRPNCSIIQYVDLSSKKKKQRLLNATTNITDISLIKTKDTKILAATLIGGAIELFKENETTPYARLEIEGGKDVGKFVGLFNSSNVIIDEVYKGIWYDNFDVKITDFEFDDISKLKDTIQIGVLEESNNDEMEFGEDEVDEADGINDEDREDEDVADAEDEKANENFECADLQEFSELIKPRLVRNEKEIHDNLLSDILSQNTTFAKPLIYMLSISESNILFAKIAYIISQYSNAINPDYTTIHNVKIWLKWIIILRGSILTQSEESIGWLKLLQSEFNQESRVLNNMIKLTGKLSLLRDQLSVRNEMMRKNVGDESENEDEDGVEETTLDGASVVLDGEGGFDEEDEDEDEDEDEARSEESGEDEK